MSSTYVVIDNNNKDREYVGESASVAFEMLDYLKEIPKQVKLEIWENGRVVRTVS